MTRKQKLLERLMASPHDFTYDELKRLLLSVDFVEMKNGKTSGSRVLFVHQPTQLFLRIHKPHPVNCLKMYQIRLVIDTLRKVEEIE